MNVADNPPAFPSPDWNGSWNGPDAFHGMTLRDWFAGQALATLQMDWAFIQQAVEMDRLPEEHAGKICFAIADGMLAARGEA